MALNPQTITALSRTIAEDYGPRLEILGVAATHGGSDRVELLVNIVNRNEEPHLRMLNLTRTRTADFERDFRAHLQNALE